MPDQSWTPLFEWPTLSLTPKASRTATIRHNRPLSSPKVESAPKPRGRFKCREPQCRKLRAYQSQSGLSVHLRNAHDIISESKWAIQKREVRARKRGDPDAPPRRRPGPPPGTPKSRLCMRCRGDIRTISQGPDPTATLPPGDVEYVRRRMVWLMDRAAERLAIDLKATDTDVREALWAVMGNKLAPPRAARSRVNAVNAYGTTGERPTISMRA